MTSRRAAHDADPFRIDVEPRGVFADEADGVAAIANILRESPLRAEPVSDGEEGDPLDHEDAGAGHLPDLSRRGASDEPAARVSRPWRRPAS